MTAPLSRKPQLSGEPKPTAGWPTDQRTHGLLIGLLLCALTLLVYSNSFRVPIIFDSKGLLLQDPRIRAATSENVALILKHTYWWPFGEAGIYRPVTTLSYLFDYAILGDGDQAAGYHWVNLALHMVNVLLVFALSRKLLGQLEPSALLAALWAVHLSVAAKKGTKMAAKWSPARGAVRSEPFPLLRSVVRNGPEPSRARRCWARRSEPLTARTVLR